MTKNQRGAVNPMLIVIGLILVAGVVVAILFATGVFEKSTNETKTTNTTANANKAAVPDFEGTLFTEETYHYSIEYPENWEYDTDENITAFFTPEGTAQDESVFITINVSTFPTTVTQEIFDQIVEESRTALAEFTGITYTKDESNNQGTTFGHIFEHDTTQNDIQLHSLQMIYVKGDQTFVLTGQTLTESWPDFKNTIEGMFDTFEIT